TRPKTAHTMAKAIKKVAAMYGNRFTVPRCGTETMPGGCNRPAPGDARPSGQLQSAGDRQGARERCHRSGRDCRAGRRGHVGELVEGAGRAGAIAVLDG